MRVVLRIAVGIGGGLTKTVEMSEIPSVGQEVMLPIGKGSTDVPFKVFSVSDNFVQLSSNQLCQDAVDDSWERSFIWPV